VATVFAIELPEGEPDRDPQRRRAYTPEEAMTLARVWERETGSPPTKNAWDANRQRRRIRVLRERIDLIEGELDRYMTGGYPSMATVLKLFGGWNPFLAACGWEPRERARPRIASAPEPPVTPTSDQRRRGAGLHLDEQRRRELAAQTNGDPGPTLLASRIRAVAAAQKTGEREWLAGELDSLAAAAVRWADKLRGKPEPSSVRLTKSDQGVT
jgi:hypothetical protein